MLQPKGAYAYKIALPSRPQPGQTPWPASLPPVVAGAVGNTLGEVTNRQRPASQSTTYRVRSSTTSAGSSSSSLARSNTMAAARPSPPAVAATVSAPPVHTWSYGLNPLLGPGGGLLWTIRAPTSYIKTRISSLSTPGPLTYTHRSQPVQADQRPLVLVVALPGAPIRIQAERIGDLVDSLSDVLSAQATAMQWAAADQRLATAAYRARCGADPNELAKGIKRVDLLGPNAAFAGLVPAVSPTGTREWVLRVVIST